MRKIQGNDKGDFVVVQVIVQVSGRTIRTERLIDREQRSVIQMQVFLQAQGHFVEMTVNTFQVITDFKKCLIFFFRISDIIRFTESLESGIVAIGFQPETGNLVDPFFNTVFVTVVFGC